MSNRYNSRRNRYKQASAEKNKTFAAVIIIFSALILIGLFLYLYCGATRGRDDIDANYCRKDYPRAITVILIDHTDRLNVMQRTSLETSLLDIANSIPKNSVIKVYSVGNVDSKALSPEVDQCNPGDGADVSDITGNKPLAKAKYERKFITPIKNIINRDVNDKGDTESPIMESIQSVNITSFFGKKNKAAKKKLILVSDLLQNSANFSVYKGVPDFGNFINSAYWKSIKADFSGVEVEIFFLHRIAENKLQDADLINFWTSYFVNQGVSEMHSHPIWG